MIQRQPIEIFFCVAEVEEDQPFLENLRTHLTPLEKQCVITLWDKSQIPGGLNKDEQIRKHVASARIFLLLISPDFLADDYCNRVMNDAYKSKKRIIPVIVRPGGWRGDSVLNSVQVLPRNGIAISNHPKPDQDHALRKVAEEVEKAIQELIDPLIEPDPEPSPGEVSPPPPIVDDISVDPPQPRREHPLLRIGSILMLMVTRRWGWTVIGTLVLLIGVLWGYSSPTVPYINSPDVSDGYTYMIAKNNRDIYIYPNNKSAVFIARHDDFLDLIDLAKTQQHMLLYFVARPDTISVNDTIGGNVPVTEAHVIEQLKLSDANKNPLATYTASDYNDSGYYESRWWPIAVGLIAAGLLVGCAALFVGRKRRKGAL